MIGIGAILLALGLADLVAGDLAGEPRSLGRVGWGVGLAVLTVFSICWVTGFALMPSMVLSGLAAFGSCVWLVLRVEPADGEPRVTRLWAAFGSLGGALACVVVFSGNFRPTGKVRPAWIFESLELPLLATWGLGRILLLAGSIVFLVASANGVVRSVLTLANAKPEVSEQRLKAGRFIGPLERLLIYGLAVANEPTAAALVVSAKSLLRIPELSSSAARKSENRTADGSKAEVELSEYILLGSLVSWFVALVLAFLIHAL